VTSGFWRWIGQARPYCGRGAGFYVGCALFQGAILGLMRLKCLSVLYLFQKPSEAIVDNEKRETSTSLEVPQNQAISYCEVFQREAISKNIAPGMVTFTFVPLGFNSLSFTQFPKSKHEVLPPAKTDPFLQMRNYTSEIAQLLSVRWPPCHRSWPAKAYPAIETT
jgi:hypothetical protein